MPLVYLDLDDQPHPDTIERFALEVDDERFAVSVARDPATGYTDASYTWLRGGMPRRRPSRRALGLSDKPQQVAVWTFEAYSPEEVVGVRFDEDSFSVFVAESTSGDRVDHITDALIGAG